MDPDIEIDISRKRNKTLGKKIFKDKESKYFKLKKTLILMMYLK
jgi:hypothetical protein